MAEQQLKPALGPLEQALANIRGGGLSGLLETINPELRTRPEYKNLQKGGKFAYDFVTDPLNLISTTPQGVAAAGIFKTLGPVLARKVSAINKKLDANELAIRRERNNISTDGRAAEVNLAKLEKRRPSLLNERDKIFKEIKTETGLDLNLPVKPPGLRTGIFSSARAPAIITSEFDPKQLAKKFNENRLFHGSDTTGIKTLKLPESFGSKGGTYTVPDIIDPRLGQYSSKSGSVYSIAPQLERTLDVTNMPRTARTNLTAFLKELEEAEEIGGLTQNEAINFINTKQLLGDFNKYNFGFPTSFGDEIGELLRKQEFDSVYLPPRKNFKGEGSTVISLKPETNLPIEKEITNKEFLDKIFPLL